MIRYSPLFLMLFITVALNAQDGPIKDYIANYYEMLNNLGDADLPLRDRRMFRSELLDQYFLFEGSMVWNELRPEGSRYIPPREYLDLIITDFPNGIVFRYDQLEVLSMLPEGGNLNAEIRLTAFASTGKETMGPFPLRFVLSIREYSSTGIIARIKSIDRFQQEMVTLPLNDPDSSLTIPPILPGAPSSVSDEKPVENDTTPVQPQVDSPDPSLRAVANIESSMAYIVGGIFSMGDENREENRSPIHLVSLNSFYIGRFEITIGEFNQFVEETGYITYAEKQGKSKIVQEEFWTEAEGINWRHDETGKPRPSLKSFYPVIHISWYDAINYCNWLSRQHGFQTVYTISQDSVAANWDANGYRLPTEAEWEFAARSRGEDIRWAGITHPYGLRAYANFCDRNCNFFWGKKRYDDGATLTARVGSYYSNALKLHDMSGNVAEWCWDRYDPKYYRESTDNNPTGPFTGDFRVVRGGSWGSHMKEVECTYRNFEYPNQTSATIGFRLCRNAD
ncbi:formylglycine-generating enzyme family protein [Phaeodactylibacter xiamenensis]|uniref:formylglycine-generating enzyme family protein n=1 Tax=Phaeodactylibacter xiamenensis TaxID=1524460 RepID=UPI0024A88697|nr:formylglycine-generating enzyme family protein [Phaeodactylibacter xiamenensis]